MPSHREEKRPRVHDWAIVAVLSHGLWVSKASVLNIEHWSGKRLTAYRSKEQNVSEVPLVQETQEYLEAYLERRRQQEEGFEPLNGYQKTYQ